MYTSTLTISSSNTETATLGCLSMSPDTIVFSPGTRLVLNCSGLTGYPAQQIRWCRKQSRDNHVTEFRHNSIYIQRYYDVPLSMSCVARPSSLLLYDVTSDDNGTEFICEHGNSGRCGDGDSVSQRRFVLRVGKRV